MLSDEWKWKRKSCCAKASATIKLITYWRPMSHWSSFVKKWWQKPQRLWRWRRCRSAQSYGDSFVTGIKWLVILLTRKRSTDIKKKRGAYNDQESSRYLSFERETMYMICMILNEEKIVWCGQRGAIDQVQRRKKTVWCDPLMFPCSSFGGSDYGRWQ